MPGAAVRSAAVQIITTCSKKAQVTDLGLLRGAADEYQSRALGLGSDGARMESLTCAYVTQRRPRESGFAPLLTVVVRSQGSWDHGRRLTTSSASRSR